MDIDLSVDGDGRQVTLSVGEVTTLVWLLDVAAEDGALSSEADQIWRRTRERLTERVGLATND